MLGLIGIQSRTGMNGGILWFLRFYMEPSWGTNCTAAYSIRTFDNRMNFLLDQFSCSAAFQVNCSDLNFTYTGHIIYRLNLRRKKNQVFKRFFGCSVYIEKPLFLIIQIVYIRTDRQKKNSHQRWNTLISSDTRSRSIHSPIQAPLFTKVLLLPLIRSRLLSNLVNPHPSIHIFILLPDIILHGNRGILLILGSRPARLDALDDEIRVAVVVGRDRIALLAGLVDDAVHV